MNAHAPPEPGPIDAVAPGAATPIRTAATPSRTVGHTADHTADDTRTARRTTPMGRQLVTDEQGSLVIDVRGPRFGATITTVVLAAALIVQGSVGIGLIAWQWVAFAISTFAGLAWSPYGNLFRFLKRRLDLGPPPATEPEGPPRFAQLCGFAVTTIALVLFSFGATVAAWVAVAVVLTLSVLLAATGLCIGCELYLLGQRLRARGGSA